MNGSAADVAIVGGGIGGLALAVALRLAGVSALVYERAPVLREVGAGLLLTPNAVHVLRGLGLEQAVADRGCQVAQWEILDRAGEALQTFRFPEADAGPVNLERSTLHSLLAARLSPDELQLGQDAVAVEGSGEAATVRFASGREVVAPIVVGADGGKSLIRQQWFGAAPPRTRSYMGWRALVDFVPAGWNSGRITETWAEGSRFGIAPVSAGRSYWYATENMDADAGVNLERSRAHLLERFGRWHAPIPELIERTPPEAILRTAISEHAPLRTWRKGRVTLLGDAAHLMTPNLGQGAAMALEDAWALAQSVAKRGPTPAALDEYERERRSRAMAVSWASRQVGRLIQLENGIAWRIRNGALRLTPDWLGQATLSPVFSFRIGRAGLSSEAWS